MNSRKVDHDRIGGKKQRLKKAVGADVKHDG